MSKLAFRASIVKPNLLIFKVLQGITKKKTPIPWTLTLPCFRAQTVDIAYLPLLHEFIGKKHFDNCSKEFPFGQQP